jgi:predicted NBD/HSP70 family sugar kinase
MPNLNFFAGVDLGGTKVNVTLLGDDGTFRISEMLESPSLVEQGPAVTLRQMEVGLKQAAKLSGIDMRSVKAVGLDTPGPASADGVISAQGSTNLEMARGAVSFGLLRQVIGLPRLYQRWNAAALHHRSVKFGRDAKFPQ